MHWSLVIQAHGTTYLSVLPPSSKANLELTDAREAQVPATTASIKPDADIIQFRNYFDVKNLIKRLI